MAKRLPEPTVVSDPLLRGYIHELLRELQFEFVLLDNTIAGLNTPKVTAISAAYTPSITDYTVECTANTFAVTLPDATNRLGKIYNIKNSGSGVITINTTSSQTVDGDISGAITLIQYENLTVQSNGTNWMVL